MVVYGDAPAESFDNSFFGVVGLRVTVVVGAEAAELPKQRLRCCVCGWCLVVAPAAMLSLKVMSSLKVLLSLKFKLSLKAATGMQRALSDKATLSRKNRLSSIVSL